MITNWASFIAFIIGVGNILVYMFFLTPRQLREVLRPQDALTGLRKIILFILIVGVITSITPTAYSYFRAIGQEYEFLRNISAILSRVSSAATTILLVMVYTYRRKDT